MTRRGFILFTILLALVGGGVFVLWKKPSPAAVAAVEPQQEKLVQNGKKPPQIKSLTPSSPAPCPVTTPLSDLPEIDRVFELFTTGSFKLPIVQTLTYSSEVSWLKGRPAWVADYAAHYHTSRHFIARSLNGGPDYFSQTVQEGSHFNVFALDKTIEFYLVVDLSRLRMILYYFDVGTNERVLLKTCRVGLGKPDPSSPSGFATPLGRFKLGDKVAIYKPGTLGFHGHQEVEMITVFGTRWLPFGEGYGIHGVPWVMDGEKQVLVENRSAIGKYVSEGSIYVEQEALEELFAIVITKPTHVEIVKHFSDAQLPGRETATPRKE
jgi:hypothetical protein